jgi:hypothetical protein
MQRWYIQPREPCIRAAGYLGRPEPCWLAGAPKKGLIDDSMQKRLIMTCHDSAQGEPMWFTAGPKAQSNPSLSVIHDDGQLRLRSTSQAYWYEIQWPMTKDGNFSDLHEIGFVTPFTILNKYGFECSRTRIQNGCLKFITHSDIHSIWKTTFTNFLYR